MTIQSISPEMKDDYNHTVSHPLQSFEWGEFRKETGVKVVRVGKFSGKKLEQGYQVTIHTIPHSPYTIGYFPKGPKPDNNMLEILTQIGQENKCIFIRLEPNIESSAFSKRDLTLLLFTLKVPYKGLFTKYSFVLELTVSEEQLFADLKPKTRYNIRLAQRKGVEIMEDNSSTAFKEYLTLTKETTKRQHFYAHDETYHTRMWETLHPAGIAHLFRAIYQNKTIATWILFLFNNVLYYPYGASSSENREVMASNLMMWEAIRWGKQHNAKFFDMWGALPPNPDPKDDRQGFHRFKEGYSPRHVEFAGSFDLILHPFLYNLYQTADRLRWFYLKIKK